MFQGKKKDIIYLDKGFDKDVFNFIGIETVYSKCYIFFSL